MRRLPPLRSLLMLVGFALGLLHCRPAHAYAWMIKNGFAKCDTCHTDPSGGETLTLMGRAQAEQLLSWGGEDRTELRGTSQFFFGEIPEPPDLRLGGSYRHLFVYTAPYEGAPSDLVSFPMQVDLYGWANLDLFVLGGSLGVARGIEGTAHVRGAQLNRELGAGWILLSRTHFIGVRLDRQTLLRAGRLNLPFGVRVPEHVLWAREATRTDRESDQQHGMALAYAGGPLRLEGMVIAGNFQLYPDRYRERGYALSGEYLIGNTSALGLSSLITRANEDRFTQADRAVRHAHGLHGRFGLSPQVALLAEVDVLKEGGRGVGYTGFVQADYEPVRGLHLMLTAEGLDQGASDAGGARSPGNGEPRLGAWASVSWHFFSHFELRLDALKRQESAFSSQVQLHMFL